jgi:Flp pilus assembly protein TadD
VFSDAGQTTNALASIQQFLDKEPSHPEALGIRARCRLKLGQVEAALADFTLAIAKSKTPEPDLFLERARAQAAAGQFANAVSGLDEGMGRIGAVVPLQLAAIEYDRQRADFTAALARLDKLLANQPVQEPWRVLRGEILAQSGQFNEARAAFKQALDGIEKYPPVRRNLEMTRQLETRIRDNLARIEARQLSSR